MQCTRIFFVNILLLFCLGAAQTVVRAHDESNAQSVSKVVGVTQLHYAVKAGNALLVADLLSNGGININSQDPTSGQTALHVAVSYGLKKITEMLIRHGASVSLPSYDPVNPYPIHLAAIGNHEDILKMLILSHANVDQRSVVGGRTALHKAAKIGLFSIVVTLVRAGRADTSLKDNHGKTALDIAVDNNWGEIVTFLKRYKDCLIADDKGSELETSQVEDQDYDDKQG